MDVFHEKKDKGVRRQNEGITHSGLKCGILNVPALVMHVITALIKPSVRGELTKITLL